MATLKRSHPGSTRKLPRFVLLLLALGGFGLFAESRVNSAYATEVQTQPQSQELQQQGLPSEDMTMMGVSGGRARGGSFRRSAPPSGGAVPTTPSYGDGYGGYRGGYDGSYYPRSGPIVVPAPYPGGYVGYPGSTTIVGPGIGTLFVLAVFGFTVLPLLFNLMRLRGSFSGGYGGSYGGSNEISNDTVTVTQLQVALLAQARTLQTELTDLASRADVESQEGLTRFLQETVLALLRSPEYWSHARLNSQTARSREQAAQVFEQLSIAERSKVTRETLVNTGGGVRRAAFTPRQDADPAAYIVVTLLIGTADDRSILDAPIHSASDLQAALQRLGSISPDYLMTYELLWSPQDERDSLSYDDLLASYPNLTQIA